jgi:hypothetical protein
VHKQSPPPTSVKRDRHGFRGVPPPPDFSLAALADDTLLTEYETAAVLRVSTNTLGCWRREPDHPLKWEVIAGRLVRYQAGNLRAYLSAGPRPRGRPPKPPVRSRRSPAVEASA